MAHSYQALYSACLKKLHVHKPLGTLYKKLLISNSYSLAAHSDTAYLSRVGGGQPGKR